ncbi:MAG: hypothetical protein HY847_15235 [Betaproteobacteria bacterium]|nr:hypothetical protein [Betaproteobacteria bacterium]
MLVRGHWNAVSGLPKEIRSGLPAAIYVAERELLLRPNAARRTRTVVEKRSDWCANETEVERYPDIIANRILLGKDGHYSLRSQIVTLNV